MDGICVICRENLTPPTVYELPCSHMFHKDCLLQHFRIDGRCPICRAEPENANAHILVPMLGPWMDGGEEVGNLREEMRHLKTELALYRHIGWAVSCWPYGGMCHTHKLIYRMCHMARSIQFCYGHDTTQIESEDDIVEPAPFSEVGGL